MRIKLGVCQNVLDRVSNTASLCNQDASANAPCLACSRIWFSSKLATQPGHVNTCLRYMLGVTGALTGTSCYSGSAKSRCRAAFKTGIKRSHMKDLPSCVALQKCPNANDVCVSKDSMFKQFNNNNIDLCGFPDADCKAKLAKYTEDKMSTIALAGGIFVLLFSCILYFTWRGINVYRTSDDE